MKVFMLILAILGIIAGVLGTLTMIVMGLAGGANSSPAEIRTIKLVLIGIAIFGLITLGGGITLAAYGRTGLAAIVGVLPMLVIVAFVVVLTIQQVFK